MSELKDDGGTAFPSYISQRDMSLRDYIAAKVVAALVNGVPHKTRYDDGDDAELTGAAYRVADAMLKARSS